MIVRQSDLASFSYCGMRQHLERVDEANGRPRARLSATIFGSVIHFALEVLQRLVHEGREDALEVAIATFEKYWDPAHTAEICEGPPTIWIAQQTYGGLHSAGIRSLRAAHEWMTGRGAKDILLATEYSFDVPIEVDGEEHILHGTIDRLCLRQMGQQWYLGVDDWKSAVKPDHLQFNMQFTCYSWASLQPAFWQKLADAENFEELERRAAGRGFALYEAPPFPDGSPALPVVPRRGRWFSVRGGDFSVHDAGIRTELHYGRMRLAISQYVRAMRGEFYPLTTDTKKCAYCQFARPTDQGTTVCGDAPMPALQIGVDDAPY